MNDMHPSPEVVEVMRTHYRETIEKQLDQYHDLYEKTGNRSELLWCVDLCGRVGIAMPPWLAAAFHESLWKYNDAEVEELGEAFGMVRSKRSRTQALKKLLSKIEPITKRVLELHAANYSINASLFEMVGKENNISGSTTRDYYYMAQKIGIADRIARQSNFNKLKQD